MAIGTTAIVFTLGGVLCAWIWAKVADPPTYSAKTLFYYKGLPYPDEQAMWATFNVEGTFLVIALVAALLLGAGCAALFPRYGVVTVFAVLVGSAAGYLTMRYLGLELGPEPLQVQKQSAETGDLLYGQLRVRATGVYFAWPVGALAGAIAALWVIAPGPHRTDQELPRSGAGGPVVS